jgi:hypothetical protein
MNTHSTGELRPMTCNRAMGRLWEFLDEELPQLESECMRHHLARCPTCGTSAAMRKRFLQRLAAVRSTCGDTPAVRRRISATLAFQALLPDWRDADTA